MKGITKRGTPRKRIPKGSGVRVEFRTSADLLAAVEAKAKRQGLTPREAWEQAGKEWADR